MNILFFFLFIASLMTSNIYLTANQIDEAELNQQTQTSEQFKSFVFITCSGKSGSITLFQSFRSIGAKTYYAHLLEDEHIAGISNEAKDTNVILIDSIRDIIARKIASYFHNLTLHIGLSPAQIFIKYQEKGSEFLNFLIQDFNEKILQIETYHSFDRWKKLGYNCLKDSHFDFEKKYQLKKIGNIYFINLRFDDIEDWHNIICSIPIPIDLKNFKILPNNLAREKWYKDLYQDFLNQFTLSQASFDAILSDMAEILDHFYTEQEIEIFINKWKPFIRPLKQ